MMSIDGGICNHAGSLSGWGLVCERPHLLAAEAVLEFCEELRNAQEAAGERTAEVLAQGSGQDLTSEKVV
jgi:hypothetical protein